VYFEWSEAGELAPEEYYVLIIYHREGEARVWVKGTAYHIDEFGRELRWLSEYGPKLEWRVAVARKGTTDPNEHPGEGELIPCPTRKAFYWHRSRSWTPGNSGAVLVPLGTTRIPAAKPVFEEGTFAVFAIFPVLVGLALASVGGVLVYLRKSTR
jgi:hypothetical protein